MSESEDRGPVNETPGVIKDIFDSGKYDLQSIRPTATPTTPSAQKNCLQFTQNCPWINYPTSLFQSYA